MEIDYDKIQAAAQAFLDGTTVLTMIENEMITEEQITEELCRRVREVSERFKEEL